MTVIDALLHLTAGEIHQPVLLRIDHEHYVKVENFATLIFEPSCFVDFIDLLLHAFPVLDVQYPEKLDLIYNLLEHVLPSTSSLLISS